jgi:Flp pilus assembly protein TadD
MQRMESVYDLYQRGCDLLDHGDHQAAILPLSKARNLEPDKASIREALGRALFHAQRYEDAAEEFQAVAAGAPTNDYALFCLGRSMQMLGRHREARHPLALACSLRPDRADYKLYRDRARRDAERA